MKSIKKTFFLILLSLSFPAWSATSPEPYLESITQNQDIVNIVVNCETPYRIGSNVYTLTIGDVAFTKSIHTYQGSVDVLTFELSNSQFNALTEGSTISLSYGELTSSNQSWSLGELNKTLTNQ